MTFSLRKLSLQQANLTVTMIISCVFVDTRNLFMSFTGSELKIFMFLIGNINHPKADYFQCVLGVETEREFSCPCLRLTEVKQIACEKFRLFLIAPITDYRQ